MLLDQLANIVAEAKEIDIQLENPEVYGNPKKLKVLNRKKKSLEEVVRIYHDLKRASDTIVEAEEMLDSEKDPEIIELAKVELSEAKIARHRLEEEAKIALVPKDAMDDRNILIEIRPAAGGDEAGLFAGELGRMYIRFAEIQGWQTEILEHQAGDQEGSAKFVLIKIIGDMVYSKMKYESGVHRVQRIPITESQGRVQTSTATVAVLPETEEEDIEIRQSDLKLDTYRASGAGGQHVNKTDSAVRLTHIPTGVVVACQDGRSQLKNRAAALNILRSKLVQAEAEKKAREQGQARLAQVGTGDRSEKIRTYNFPQDRLTDHRIGQNFANLPSIMNGNIDKVMETLLVADQSQRMAEMTKSSS